MDATIITGIVTAIVLVGLLAMFYISNKNYH